MEVFGILITFLICFCKLIFLFKFMHGLNADQFQVWDTVLGHTSRHFKLLFIPSGLEKLFVVCITMKTNTMFTKNIT